MSDLSSSSSSDVTIVQSDSNLDNSTNSTLNSLDNGFYISYDTMQILFLAIATITVLICFTICLTVCICICLKRRREPNHHENKDQLLPEQSSKKSTKITTNNPTKTNGKQGLSNQHSLNSTNTVPSKPFYYDNLDDIPFIDESRPTSIVDITQV